MTPCIIVTLCGGKQLCVVVVRLCGWRAFGCNFLCVMEVVRMATTTAILAGVWLHLCVCDGSGEDGDGNSNQNGVDGWRV